ncbi:hypothetical protein SynROS8604_01224 [Synechococcus sp. ROS8604]|nr:hypothetical protein SynROS8604_01224 [Synechococcus sp. ROS8604]
MIVWLQSRHHHSLSFWDGFVGLAMRLNTDASWWLLAQTVEMRSETL